MDVTQALIAGGSALLGSIIGGGCALWAGRQQWNRSLKARSHEAASRLLAAVASLSQGIALWETSGDGASLSAAINTFSAATVAELPLVRDDAVSLRVRTHVEFAATIGILALRVPTPSKPLIGSFKRHEDDVVSALEAHIRDQALPGYRRPPLGDIAGLIAWGK